MLQRAIYWTGHGLCVKRFGLLGGDPTAGWGVFVAAGEQSATVIVQLSRCAAAFADGAGLAFRRRAQGVKMLVRLIQPEAQRAQFLFDLHRQRVESDLRGVGGDVGGELADEIVPAILAFETEAHQVLGDRLVAAPEQFGKFGEQPFGQFGIHHSSSRVVAGRKWHGYGGSLQDDSKFTIA